MRILLFFLMLIGFTYCGNNHIPEEKDLIGKWQSSDGATFVFMKYNTFKTIDLAGEKMFDGFEKFNNKKYNENGIWNIAKDKEHWVIKLIFAGSKELRTRFFTQVYIAKMDRFKSNKQPWFIYKYIGDPDDNIIYEFIKLSNVPK